MYRKFVSKTENVIWLSDSVKDMLSSWDLANQFPPRILGELSWNICHRRWSLLGRQRLPDFCYHEVKIRHSAWVSVWWSCWRRSLRLRTTRSHKARWIRSVNPIQQSGVVSRILNSSGFQVLRLASHETLQRIISDTFSELFIIYNVYQIVLVWYP